MLTTVASYLRTGYEWEEEGKDHLSSIKECKVGASVTTDQACATCIRLSSFGWVCVQKRGGDVGGGFSVANCSVW